jgi:hypothetical protein
VTPADTPAAAVSAWVEAVMDHGDLRTGWELTDPPLRLVLAQHWVLSRQDDDEVAREDRDDLAQALAAVPPHHPLWDRFAATRIRRWRQYWGSLSTRSWDVTDDVEPLSDDLVVVTLVERHRLLGWSRPGPPAVRRRFAVRHGPEGWVVAGLDGSALFRPGWPPTQVRLPSPR